MKKLFALDDKELWKLINEQHGMAGGVYRIIAARDGTRIPVNRFLGVDNEGVLYIGKATCFLDRVIDLKKSISPDYNGTAHICGRRYKSNPRIAVSFPYGILHIDLVQSDHPEQLERELLTEYATQYGEVPPLNAI